MQNSNTILTKNSVLSSLINNSVNNKPEVNAVSPAESLNSFQQMFSRQLQQEQANNAVTKNQEAQNLINQQYDKKAQEINQERTSAAQKNAPKADGESKTNNANQSNDKKPENATASEATQPIKAKKTDDKTKAAKSNAEPNDVKDLQDIEADANKKITIADLVADLKLAKSTVKPDETSAEKSSKDEAQLDKTAQDGSLQATILASTQLSVQNNTAPTAKPEDAAIENKTDAKNIGPNNSVNPETAQQTEVSNQVDSDKATNQSYTNLLGEKTDTAKQINIEKQTGAFAENLLEKTLQSAQLNAQAKASEQAITPTSPSLSQLSAYQANANGVNGTSNYIGAYPGKSGWDQAISQKVVWMVGAGEQSATLNLNPPDLGPLQVVINVNNEKADTTFISQNIEVRKALEEGMSTLRDMMGQAGIELGQANVSTNSQAQQSFEQASKQANRSTTTLNLPNQAPEQLRNGIAVTRTSNGLVDTFA